MVLEPTTYTWSRGKKRIQARGYAAAEVPGLVIGVHDWKGSNGFYRYFDITHATSGFGFNDQFTELEAAARFLTRLGELCDWREVEPGNDLHRLVAPVVKALSEAVLARDMLDNYAAYLAQAQQEHDEKAAALESSRLQLEQALRVFQSREAS